MENFVDLNFIDSASEFPLVVTIKEKSEIDFISFLKEHKNTIDARLKKYGAILFRGLGIHTADQFYNAASVFGDLIEYKERSSPRKAVGDRIYTSTEHPADQYINMHNENSYSRSWPLKIVFYCLTPSATGGETPLADSRRVLKSLSAKTRARFADKGVKYVRNLGNSIGLDWREVFQTTDKMVVESYCHDREIDFQWIGNDRLRLTYTTPAIRKHPRTGEDVWFNHGFFFNINSLPPDFVEEILLVMSQEDFAFLSYYGDGTEIEKEVIEEIRSIYDTISVKPKWQHGDFLLLDNMLVAHGRSSYTGDRKVLVAMMEAQDYKNFA